MSAVGDQLAAVQRRIAAAAEAAGRRADDIALVCVGKGHAQASIEQAWENGARRFGESRVQEALAHWPQRRPGLELHLIGRLQTNKVRAAVQSFDLIHTLDREKLARALAAEMTAQNRKLPCFVEVNIGSEPQKAGVAPADAERFVELCRGELGLPVIGLMCIPPEGEEPAPYFALLREIARRLGLAGLSMGMSADFETAIAFGATHVRVGTAIFGERG